MPKDAGSALERCLNASKALHLRSHDCQLSSALLSFAHEATDVGLIKLDKEADGKSLSPNIEMLLSLMGQDDIDYDEAMMKHAR